MWLHLYLPFVFLKVFHHCVESRAARLLWRRDSVHVEFYGDHATLEEMLYLLCDIEDEGGVVTVRELHVYVYVVFVWVVVVDSGSSCEVWVVVTDSEGNHPSSNDVHLFPVSLNAFLHAYIII